MIIHMIYTQHKGIVQLTDYIQMINVIMMDFAVGEKKLVAVRHTAHFVVDVIADLQHVIIPMHV